MQSEADEHGSCAQSSQNVLQSLPTAWPWSHTGRGRTPSKGPTSSQSAGWTHGEALHFCGHCEISLCWAQYTAEPSTQHSAGTSAPAEQQTQHLHLLHLPVLRRPHGTGWLYHRSMLQSGSCWCTTDVLNSTAALAAPRSESCSCSTRCTVACVATALSRARA